MASDGSGEDEAYESDEYPELHPNFIALQTRIRSDLSFEILSWRKLTRGRYHEIYVLQASEDRSYIARFSRFAESPAKLQSEAATMRYVRANTSIPVPELYLFDVSPENGVGMQFMIMEHMEGQHLYRIWDDLSIEHQKAALSEIAKVLAQLASCEFDSIGSLQADLTIGPLMHSVRAEENGIDTILTKMKGPFTSPEDYLESFIDDVSIPPHLVSLMSDVRGLIHDYFVSHGQDSLLQPPFRLIHADFDGQNMLFSIPDSQTGDPPRLTAIIDWEYAHSGPLYFLYEYPIFIQDVDWSKDLYEKNAVLRPALCKALRGQFLEGSKAWEDARAALPSGRSARLNNFSWLFMQGWNWSMVEEAMRGYVNEEKQGLGKPYDGRIDWTPDPDV